ncbi:hypothetical protein [Xanthomonas sp. 10-10]|uniref:Secreted protein n=1 Tax=Xanthomonas sp. 10-10 TaxID=3115848 RepID=A0AAU7P9Y4_9XANT
MHARPREWLYATASIAAAIGTTPCLGTGPQAAAQAQPGVEVEAQHADAGDAPDALGQAPTGRHEDCRLSIVSGLSIHREQANRQAAHIACPLQQARDFQALNIPLTEP